MEKSRRIKKAICKLKEGDKLYQSNTAIMRHLFEYYEKLFQEHPVDEKSDFLDGLDIPKVKPEDMAILDSPILLQEIEITVKQLASDKCSGPDGFPMNFIK